MPTPRETALPWQRTTLSAVSEWRHSWFWTIVPVMFLASCACMLVLMFGATVLEDRRLREVLAPAALESASGSALRKGSPLLTKEGVPTAWCSDTLHVLAERVLAEAIGDRTGDSNENGFHRALKAGRLGVELRGAGGSTCQFGSDNTDLSPALRRGMDAARQRTGRGQVGMIVELPDGWVSTTTIALPGPGSPTLTLGAHMLSPLSKLTQPRSVFAPLAVFILCMNVVAALVLVLLLLRRIRRADAAATAWTLGKLDTRINDTGRDELSRLTHKFDIMADAMSGVIQVKQSLAAAEERNRLARDLHDSAKQRAFALNLQLSAARVSMSQHPHSVQLIDAALRLTGQLQQDLSSVIQRLGAPTIVESGFRNVLSEALDALLAGSKMRWSLSLSASDELALAAMADAPHQLFLITIEAVANALKHANCTDCQVSCERQGSLFIWRICDNGREPLPSFAGSKGMGLANMKLRADSLDDGSFDILPSAGGGTTIVITFRLPTTKPA